VQGSGGEGAEGVECRGNGKAEVPGFRLRVMSTDPICRTRAAQCAGPPANTHFGLGGRAWLPGLLQTLLSLILGTHHALKLAPDPAPHSLHCHPQTHAPAAPAPLKDTRLHPLKRTHLIVQVFIQRLPHLHAWTWTNSGCRTCTPSNARTCTNSGCAVCSAARSHPRNSSSSAFHCA